MFGNAQRGTVKVVGKAQSKPASEVKTLLPPPRPGLGPPDPAGRSQEVCTWGPPESADWCCLHACLKGGGWSWQVRL